MIKNVEMGGKLTHKQSQVIILLLKGNSVETAAKAVGVAANTVYRWLETDLLFKRTFSQAKDKIFSEALEDLKMLSREAVKTLKDLLLIGHKDTARLGSAKIIFEIDMKNKELEEIEKRIEILESKLGGE